METKSTEKMNGESSDPLSKDYMMIQAINSRLLNANTVRDFMAKLWSELEFTIFGKKADHQELKRKHTVDKDDEEQEVNG